MNKVVLFCSWVLTCGLLQATTVEWNRFTSIDAEVWDTGPIWMVMGYSDFPCGAMPTMILTYASGGIAASPHMGGMSDIWVRQLEEGDIVNADSMFSHGDEYFYRSEYGNDIIKSNYNAIFEADTLYLGYATYGYKDDDPYMIYGWVEIDKQFNAVSSAWDVDGGAMYVGGGSAVPEPSTIGMVLLGIGFIGLRRRKLS